jgi:predicted nucleic acid-binding protein
MRYIIDAWAWIEYLIGSDYGSKISLIIENEKNEIFTCSLTIAEVISMIKREKKDYELAYKSILSLSQICNITPELSKEAGLIHPDIKKKMRDFGLADVFILVTAKMLNSQIVTGDEHFKNFKNVVFIK